MPNSVLRNNANVITQGITANELLTSIDLRVTERLKEFFNSPQPAETADRLLTP